MFQQYLYGDMVCIIFAMKLILVSWYFSMLFLVGYSIHIAAKVFVLLFLQLKPNQVYLFLIYWNFLIAFLSYCDYYPMFSSLPGLFFSSNLIVPVMVLSKWTEQNITKARKSGKSILPGQIFYLHTLGVINRPGVAGAVLQTPLTLFD